MGQDGSVYDLQTGDDPVTITKGDAIGHWSLIYQDSKEDYLNEMGHMDREASAEKAKWKDLRQNIKGKSVTKYTQDGTGLLSEAWVKEAFDLSTNETL